MQQRLRRSARDQHDRDPDRQAARAASQGSSAPNRPVKQALIGAGGIASSSAAVDPVGHLQRPDRGDRRKQQGVEVAGRDAPSRPAASNRRAVGAHPVAALVVVQLVVPAPHPGLARDGGGQVAAGPHQPRQRGHRGGVLVHMLDHVEGADQVEARRRERQAVRQQAALDPHRRRARRHRRATLRRAPAPVTSPKRCSMARLPPGPQPTSRIRAGFGRPRRADQARSGSAGGPRTTNGPPAAPACGHRSARSISVEADPWRAPRRSAGP